MPAPTMQTSHSASSARGGKSGTSAVAIQADVVAPESVFGLVMVERREGSCIPQLDICNSEALTLDQRSVGSSTSVRVYASSASIASPHSRVSRSRVMIASAASRDIPWRYGRSAVSAS